MNKMNKMNIQETTKYLEEIIDVRIDSFFNEDWEIEDNLHKHTTNLLQKQSLLDLLVIKTTTDSIVLKCEVEEEIKRRVELARKNND